MPLLELSNLEKAFGATPVLRDIALKVQEGEIVSLLGPSGCGKSTLLRIIAGLEQADGGEVLLARRDITALPPGARNIAMVFQSLALYPHLSAGENIALPLRVRHLTKRQRLLSPLRRMMPTVMPEATQIEREIESRVDALAEKLELSPLLDRRPAELSGGQRQRVAIARALSRPCRLLLLDEPLSSLDAQLRVQARDEIVRIARDFNLACLFVTHDQGEAFAISDRVAVMLEGRMAQCATPTALYRDPASLAVARFVGTPTLNLIEGRQETGGRLRFGPFSLDARLSLAPDHAVTVGIRPEALRIAPAATGQSVMRVERVETHGHEALVHLHDPLHGLDLRARVADAGWLRRREAVSVLPAADDLMFFDGTGARLMPAPLSLPSLAHA